jgi:hypothetical protein
MHRLLKIDAVENLDFVPFPLQELPALGQYRAFRVGHDIA